MRIKSSLKAGLTSVSSQIAPVASPATPQVTGANVYGYKGVNVSFGDSSNGATFSGG
jgi:hypothetical protein